MLYGCSHILRLWITLPVRGRFRIWSASSLKWGYKNCCIKVQRGKLCPRRRHEDPEGGKVQLYPFFNLGTWWNWVVSFTPRPLYPREWPGGWVGHRAGLDGCGIGPCFVNVIYYFCLKALVTTFCKALRKSVSRPYLWSARSTRQLARGSTEISSIPKHGTERNRFAAYASRLKGKKECLEQKTSVQDSNFVHHNCEADKLMLGLFLYRDFLCLYSYKPGREPWAVSTWDETYNRSGSTACMLEATSTGCPCKVARGSQIPGLEVSLRSFSECSERLLWLWLKKSSCRRQNSCFMSYSRGYEGWCFLGYDAV